MASDASGSSTQPPPPGQTPPPLPSLAGLSCSKLSPAPKRQRAADAADDADAAPSAAPDAGAAPSAAPSAEWTVTQADAKAWFEAAGEANTIGEGVYGETRQAQACDRWVAIKRFLDDNRAKARTEAKTEVDNHLAVWRRSGDQCRQYISEPAVMEFETEESEGTYTVQSLIREPGLSVQPFVKVRDRDYRLFRGLMPQTSTDYKIKICKAYGRMRACIAKAGVAHNDLHLNNVLVLTNYPMDDEHLKEYTDWTSVLKDEKRDAIEIQWRVVDWGLAQVYDETGPSEDRDEICWRPKAYAPTDDAQHDSKLGYWNQNGTCIPEKRDEITSRLFSFLFEGAEPSDCSGAKTERDCVTVADVHQWVQEAFAEALGKRIPDDLAAATERKARLGRRARGFPDGGGASSA